MKNWIAALLLAPLLAFSQVSHARPSEPLQSPQQATLTPSASGPAAIGRVHDVIISAGGKHGWHVAGDKPGELTLHNDVRGKHEVEVNVFYDSSNVRVEYVSSDDLDYHMRDGVAYIHPKYNEWVHVLLKDIVNTSSR